MTPCKTREWCGKGDGHAGGCRRGPITRAARRLHNLDPVDRALLEVSAVVADRLSVQDRAAQYWRTISDTIRALAPKESDTAQQTPRVSRLLRAVGDAAPTR